MFHEIVLAINANEDFNPGKRGLQNYLRTVS